MLKKYFILALTLQAISFAAVAADAPRSSRWEGSVRGCLGNSTPVEWQKYGSKLPRFCTCLATFLVHACAPADSTTSDAFSACAQKYTEKQLLDSAAVCLKQGTEPDKNPYSK